jgi:hypothetical protein
MTATEERVVANVGLDVAVRERAATASFGRTLLKTGLSAVALDDDGMLTQFFPDGATRPLEIGPQAATQSAEVRSRQSGPTAST